MCCLRWLRVTSTMFNISEVASDLDLKTLITKLQQIYGSAEQGSYIKHV